LESSRALRNCRKRKIERRGIRDVCGEALPTNCYSESGKKFSMLQGTQKESRRGQGRGEDSIKTNADWENLFKGIKGSCGSLFRCKTARRRGELGLLMRKTNSSILLPTGKKGEKICF